MAVGVVDGPSVGVGDGPGDPQPVANTPTTTTAARVRAKAATRAAIRDASPCSAAGSEPEVRSESVERGMAGIVAWALEVAVSSSSAVLGIHTGCVVFGSRNCGTKPSEPSGPSSLSPTGGADWAGASGPPFPGGLDGAGTARPSAQHAPTQRPPRHPRRAQRPIVPTRLPPGKYEMSWPADGASCAAATCRSASLVACRRSPGCPWPRDHVVGRRPPHRAQAKKRPEGGREGVATVGAEDELVEVDAEMATREALALSRPRPRAPASTPSRPRVRFFRDTRPVRTTEDPERRRSRPEGWAARVVLRSGAAGLVRCPGALATTRFVP